MRVLVQRDAIGEEILIVRRVHAHGGDRLLTKTKFAIEFAIVIAASKEQPVAQLFFQPQSIGSLEMTHAFVYIDVFVFRAGRSIIKIDVLARGIVIIEFGAEAVVDPDAVYFMCEIELYDMDL